jgi:hypothetical protein
MHVSGGHFLTAQKDNAERAEKLLSTSPVACDDSQRSRHDARTDRRRPNEFSIGIDRHWFIRTDGDRRRLPIANNIKRTMVSGIDRMELAQNREFGNCVDKANVEKLIVEFGGGQHAEATAVRIRVAEGAEQRRSGELGSVFERCCDEFVAMFE